MRRQSLWAAAAPFGAARAPSQDMDKDIETYSQSALHAFGGGRFPGESDPAGTPPPATTPPAASPAQSVSTSPLRSA